MDVSDIRYGDFFGAVFCNACAASFSFARSDLCVDDLRGRVRYGDTSKTSKCLPMGLQPYTLSREGAYTSGLSAGVGSAGVAV